MAEPPDETNPERPGFEKPKYLPRIIYKPPEPDPESESQAGRPPVETPPSPKPAKSKAAKSRTKDRSEKPDGVLLEETPELDTFDSRRRVRLIIGSVAVVVLLFSLLTVVRALRPAPLEEGASPSDNEIVAAKAPSSPSKTPAQQEAAARQLLSDARAFEKAGKLDLALERVQRVLDSFGDAPSAKVAREARKRHEQGLPLFVDVAAVIATRETSPQPSEAPEEEAADPATVVVAPPAAEMPPPGSSTVEVIPPSVPGVVTAPPASSPRLAEPRRATGLGLPAADVPARALPTGFTARDGVGVHESGWPLEITCDRDGSAMVLIPGGIFIQGRDDGRPEERPAHKVNLSPYYIDQHEITANQLARFRGRATDQGDRPAVRVTLDEARAYLAWAGKTLPTEAQWEMAARTTDGRFYPWGNAPASWERPRDARQIDPVMSFARDLSPYGVFDMAGNAWEWTGDWFDTRAYANLQGQVPNDPTGPSQPKGRLPEVVIKGGSKTWDASWRSGMRPEAQLDYLGFRGVLNLTGTSPGQPRNAVPGSRRLDGVPF